MTLWKRIKNLWYLSGIDLKTNKHNLKTKNLIQELTEAVNGKKMARIVDVKEPEDLFPNEEERGNN